MAVEIKLLDKSLMGDIPFEINNEIAGKFELRKSYEFYPAQKTLFNSEDLRAIADKLDELNHNPETII